MGMADFKSFGWFPSIYYFIIFPRNITPRSYPDSKRNRKPFPYKNDRSN